MSAPIVFISHLRVRGDDPDVYARMAEKWVPRLEAEKPRTAAFLHYLDRETGRVTVVHLFADSDAMDHHFDGADERAKDAWQVLTPEGWEIYGPAGDGPVATMQREAEAAGVPLIVQPDFAAGFMRLNGG